MLNLMMLTAALSLPYESSLTNVSKILNQTENQQLSMNKSPLISPSFDKQSLETEINHQLSQELRRLHKHLNDELSSNNM